MPAFSTFYAARFLYCVSLVSVWSGACLLRLTPPFAHCSVTTYMPHPDGGTAVQYECIDSEDLPQAVRFVRHNLPDSSVRVFVPEADPPIV